MTIREPSGRLRVIGDWRACAECGTRFYQPPQTKKVCCDGVCQTARARAKRRARYLKQKADK